MFQFSIYDFFISLVTRVIKALKALSPLGDFLARLWIAKIFFESGLSKIGDWPGTLALFTNMYQVPFLSPAIAAYMGTAAELILPILLLAGLGSRISILIFFIYNLVCVISYNFLWTPQGTEGLDQHICWGLILAMLMFHGPGKISLDHLIAKRFKNAEVEELLD